MGELADLLELLHGAPESFATLSGVVRRWQHTERHRRAFDRHAEELEKSGRGGSFQILVASGGEQEEPETTEERTRLWVERPDRRREEVEGLHPRTRVSRGGKSWFHTEHFGAIEQQDAENGAGGEHDALLNPLGVVAALELSIGGERAVAGRAGVWLRGVPRESDEPLAFGFGLGAAGGDEYELVVDRERGWLLRTEARLEGEPFEVVEFTELQFDEPLDPELFVFAPPSGERIRSQEELSAEWHDELTLDEAAARASFPVFAPKSIWPHARIYVHYMQARDRPSMPENVSVHYSDDFGRHQFTLQQRAASPDASFRPDFERVDLDGVEAVVWTPVEPKRRMPTIVRLVREGTQIELSGQDVEREELLEIARSLVRARAEPPTFS